MYIVIAGAGLIGTGLAAQLAAKRHDVVLIDQDLDACHDASARTGVLAVHGNATDVDILENAGIEKADVAAATMRHDGDNLAFCLLAKSYGVSRIYARIRKAHSESTYELAGVTRTVSTTDVFVESLLLEIEEPMLRHVAILGKGKANVVIVRVPKDCAAAGHTVVDLAQHTAFPKECVISGIYRQSSDAFIFPRGDCVIEEGDQVFLTANMENIRKAAKLFCTR